MIKNVEIKARTNNLDNVRAILLANKAIFKGTDKQEDTYFRTNEGFLKLRQGVIENNLIYYQRENEADSKLSKILLYQSTSETILKEILSKALGVVITVTKTREIYFIDNVKFHLDLVEDLGEFVEIEAIDKEGTFTESQLREQCEYYQKLLQINKTDLIAFSYKDLLFQSRLGNKALLKFH